MLPSYFDPQDVFRSLLCLTPESRPLLGKCTRILVDDNQGIKDGPLFDTTREVSEPGTPGPLRFMLIRLLQVLSTPTINTALDDLESFIWVLCWAVSEICRKNRKLNRKCSTNDIQVHAEDKRAYTAHLHDIVLPLGPSFSSITPLVEKWCALATIYRKKVTCLLAGSGTSSDTR